MSDATGDDTWTEWTREGVEQRLIAAFRALPATPLFGRASRLRRADGRASPMTQVLSWLDLVEDRGDRLFLATWARCRAERESFGAMCTGMGWRRSTAEDGRRRAASVIAATLALTGGAPQVPAAVPEQPLGGIGEAACFADPLLR